MVVVPDVAFPDTESGLMAFLAENLEVETDTATPDEFDFDALTGGGLVVIQRTGGNDDGNFDYPRVSVACYGPDRTTAHKLGERARQCLLVIGGEPVTIVDPDDDTSTTFCFDYCVTDTPPENVPYGNEDVDRHVAYYRLGLRRPRRRP